MNSKETMEQLANVMEQAARVTDISDSKRIEGLYLMASGMVKASNLSDVEKSVLDFALQGLAGMLDD